jgi:glyoxylase-like metal-dependent hydrolase (beta-lactamase superfamily II)
MRHLDTDLACFTGMLLGRVYLLRDGDGVTLVDAGPWGRGGHIVRSLARADITATQVRRVLLTHADPDHVGGLRTVLAATHAELIASPLVLQQVGPRVRALASRSRAVTDGTVLRDVFGGLTVLDTPGHRPGHVAYWQPERALLLAGDAVMTGALAPVARWLAHDVERLAVDLERLARLAPTLVLPGHGPALRRGGGGLLRARAAALRGM